MKTGNDLIDYLIAWAFVTAALMVLSDYYPKQAIAIAFVLLALVGQKAITKRSA